MRFDTMRRLFSALSIQSPLVASAMKNTPATKVHPKKFFKYIHSLGEATKNYLAQFVSSLDPNLASSDPQDFYSQTQVIRTLRHSWFDLHQLVKPALDA